MNTQTQEALKMAIEALELINEHAFRCGLANDAIKACKEALAQPAQEHCVNLRMDKCEHKNICKHCEQPAQEPVSLGDFDRMTKAECVDYIDYLRKEIDLLRFKEWQGLSDNEMNEIFEQVCGKYSRLNAIDIDFIRAIEQALKEKNA